jgi:hypothetical protein
MMDKYGYHCLTASPNLINKVKEDEMVSTFAHMGEMRN